MSRPRAHPPSSAPGADLGEIYRAHLATVTRWVGRLGGPSVDVEDAVQEIFLVVQRRLSEFRGDAQLTTLLYAITDRVVRAQRRRARLRHWLSRALPMLPPPPARPGPVEGIERREATEALYRALDTLDERSRRLLILFEIEGMSGETIAALLGIKVGTVWVGLHRARARLLERLPGGRKGPP